MSVDSSRLVDLLTLFNSMLSSARFTSKYKATIGADFTTKDIAVGDSTMVLQVYSGGAYVSRRTI